MSAPTFEIVTDEPTDQRGWSSRVRFDHMCSSGALVCELPTDVWAITQRSPLTVRPSIHCGECGLHGFITDGTWEPLPGVPEPVSVG